MTDKKLSELTELAATPATDDEVYIRDVSEEAALESKRITIANLVDARLGSLGATCYVVASNAKAEVKIFAQILQGMGYLVWVCDGTADNEEIQAAIDALPAGGGRVMLSEGVFSITTKIQLTSNMSLEGQGATTILSQDGNNSVVVAEGSVGTARALDANASQGDVNITLAAGLGSNFSVGDWALLRSEATDVGAQKKGEMAQVLSVVGDVVTLTGAIQDNYATANSAALVELTVKENIKVSNIKIKNPTPDTLTVGLAGENLVINGLWENIWLEGGDGSGINLLASVGSSIRGVYAEGFTDNIGAGRYGYITSVSGAARDIVIDGLIANKGRHAFTTNQSTTIPYGCPRNIVVSNGIARGFTAHAWDTHDQGYNIDFINCIANSNPGGGLQIRSKRTTFRGGSIMWSGNGVSAVIISAIAHDATIDGLLISRSPYSNTSHHSIYITTGAERTKILNNRILYSSRSAIRTPGAVTDLQIINNLILNPGQTNNEHAILISGVSVRAIIANNHVIDNQGAPTMANGIVAPDVTANTIIAYNNISGAITANINAPSAVKRSNIGYVTENSGTATVPNTTTSIVVNHGLATTPTRVQITPRENPTNAVSFWWVDTLTATQFTINVNADPGASGLDFDWRAVVGEGN